ncbi:MAG: IS21 family transposase [Acidobacteria bacterium]|nr:IS21 family transposase [Acidobacteriota bacterium]
MNIKVLHRQGMSIREIARRTGFSRKTVRNVLSSPAPKGYGPRPRRPGKLAPFSAYLGEQLLARPWVRATQLYEEIRQEGYAGHYDLVKIFVRKHREQERARHRATVRFETGPGKEAQFDWKGPIRGLLRNHPDRVAYVFRLVMAYSRLRVTLVSLSQRLPEVLMDLRMAFERLGGAPQRLVFDNFKAAVLVPRPHLQLHPAFVDFCRAHGTELDPALPYTPERKGKMERSFGDFADPDLLHRSYETVAELQAALVEDDRRHALRVHSTTGETPLSRFEKERPFLLLLPSVPFDPRIPEVRRVLSDCTISFQAARYSVPFSLVGASVIVKADPKIPSLEIFHAGACVASHSRVPSGQSSIHEEHVADLRHSRWDRLRLKPEKASPAAIPSRSAESPHPLVPRPSADVVQRSILEYVAAIGGVQ